MKPFLVLLLCSLLASPAFAQIGTQLQTDFTPPCTTHTGFTTLHTDLAPTRATIVNMLYFLVILIPAIAVAVRRMHDVDKEWWYALIPIYNLILAVSPSTPGPNQYGAEPGTKTV